jgi:hypothetical protein
MSQTMKKRAEKRLCQYDEFMEGLKDLDSLRDLVSLYAQAKTGKMVDVDDFLYVVELDALEDIDEKIHNLIQIELSNPVLDQD